MGYADVVLEDGPVAYWMLDELSGASSIIDSSGNGYTGTSISGVTFGSFGSYPIVGSPQKSPTFSGGGNINIAGTAFLTRPFTLETWAICTAGGWTWILGSSTGGTETWWGGASDGTIDYSMFGGGDQHGSGPNIENSQWHYLVTTIAGNGDLTHYVDSIQVLFAGSWVNSPSSGTRNIGNRGGGTEGWHGSIAHFAVYNKVLSTSRITAHYVEGIRQGAVSLA